MQQQSKEARQEHNWWTKVSPQIQQYQVSLWKKLNIQVDKMWDEKANKYIYPEPLPASVKQGGYEHMFSPKTIW